MRRSKPPGFPLLIALGLLAPGAGPGRAQERADVARVPRDPDRGLDPTLREKLRLADAGEDSSWPVEQWNARIEPILEQLAEAWSSAPLPDGLASQPWIAPDLRVPALVPPELESVLDRGAWKVERAPAPRSTHAPEHELPQAVAEWRDLFGAGARLEAEVFEVDPAPGEATMRVRLTATGPGAAGRLQHNARWTCRWRRGEDGVALVALELDAFEAVSLAGSPEGLFADVTESAFAGQPVFARQLAGGLDDWRTTIPAALEPGSLGHHGLAVADVDGDDLEDVYLCQPGGLPNRLFLHQPDGSLRDISASAGVDLLDYSSSALLADLDTDGDTDLVVSTGTALVFLANDGTARFERRLTLERSLATSLAAADFDVDGDLDLYVCSYLSPYERNGLPVPYHEAENGEANVLLRNEGGWSFVDATVELGLDHNNRRFSFAAAWEDFDDDGDQDLYVANDFGLNNLYRNEGGRFRDVAHELGAEDVSAGMGVSWGDADGDGWMDLYVTNMYTPAACRLTAASDFRPGAASETRMAYRHHAMGNSLLLNRRARAFEDVAESSGTGLGRWGWGALFVDLDNDGALDLFAPNGFSTGELARDLDSYFWRQVVLQSPDEPGQSSEAYALGWRAVNRLVRQGWSWNGHERNVAYLNLGAAAFADVSGAAGLDLPDDARATARVDWDGDGDLDLLVTNRTAPLLRLLANQHAGERDWIAFSLVGTSGHPSAVGARVSVRTSSGRRLASTLRCGEGYLAQSSARLHFGLGVDEVAGVEVRWPDGASEDFGPLQRGARYRLEQGSARAQELRAPSTPSALVASRPRPPPRTGSARTVLPVPLPMTRLVIETTSGRPAPILGISMDGPRGTGHPLALVVWGSFFPQGRRQLEALAAAADELRGAGIQVLAVLVDQGEERANALAQLREIAWPFATGFASEEALLVLEQVQGTLHDSHASLAVPACLLVSPRGELIVMYQGRLDPARLVRDLELLDLPAESRRDAAVPFPGRWIAPPPGPLDEAVAARLAAHGLARAAAEYRLAEVEAVTLSGAGFQVELGLARQRQGRLDEAIRHFREALAAEPGHFLAARSLALALHQRGERSLALESYRNAIALEPTDALTRLNLGTLQLELGDLEAARGELAALRALKSELADTLEERIRLVQQGR